MLDACMRIGELDAAVVTCDDRLDDREAEAGARRRVARHAVKALEDALALRGGYAAPRVQHPQLDAALPIPAPTR